MSKSSNFIRRVFGTKSNTVLLFGSLLVFGSFVVRDELRDDYRDLAGAVAAARDSYDLKTQIKGVETQVSFVGRSVDEINERQLTGALGSLGEETGALSYVGIDAAGVSEELDYLGKLTALLPDASKLDARLNEMRTAVNGVSQQVQTKMFATAKPVAAGQQPLTFSQMSDLTATRIRLSIEVTQQEAKLIPLRVDVMNAVQSLQSAREQRYKIVNWVSIGLFVVGWLFGLMTKLLGLPAAATGD